MAENILYMIDSLHLGGTEKQLLQLARHLDPARFRPHVCTLKASNGLLEDSGLPRLCLPFRSFGHPSLLAQVARLASYIRRHDIKLVQTFFQDPFLLAALTKPLTGSKLIGSFRDLGFWRTPAETRKMRLAYTQFSGFIANSQAVADHFVRADNIAPHKIRIIYNGIDPPQEANGHGRGRGDRGLLVGIVANCNRAVKRVDDFIRAAALVYGQRQDVRFEIVGDGHLRPELERLAHSLGLEGVLSFIGSVEHPLQRIMHFDVGVISSETEGFCNAILEYMACGVPVVATAAGGNPELVREGENGYLVPVASPECLAERVLELLANQNLRMTMGQAGSKRVVQQFAPERAALDHQHYYDSLLAH